MSRANSLASAFSPRFDLHHGAVPLESDLRAVPVDLSHLRAERPLDPAGSLDCRVFEGENSVVVTRRRSP